MTPERLDHLKAIHSRAADNWLSEHPSSLISAVGDLIEAVEELTFDLGTKHEALVAGEQLFAVQVANHWHCQGVKWTCDEQPIDGRNADEIVCSIGSVVRPIVAERDRLRGENATLRAELQAALGVGRWEGE